MSSRTKKSKIISETQENKFKCDFCGKEFRAERTLVSHSCEKRRRWTERDEVKNRFGYKAWNVFYDKTSLNRKDRSYQEFMNSAYFTAFVRFGHYCAGIKCVNFVRFAEYLIEKEIPIDKWCSDSKYNSFLIGYLLEEDPFDAITRTTETMMDLGELFGIIYSDCFRYGNKNRIVANIMNGKVSPWALYQSESGRVFLEQLDEIQQNSIIEYINPEKWSLKFVRQPEKTKEIKETLKELGF